MKFTSTLFTGAVIAMLSISGTFAAPVQPIVSLSARDDGCGGDLLCSILTKLFPNVAHKRADVEEVEFLARDDGCNGDLLCSILTKLFPNAAHKREDVEEREIDSRDKHCDVLCLMHKLTHLRRRDAFLTN